VAIQFVLFVALALAGTLGPAWGDPWLAIGRVVGAVLIGTGVVVAGLGLLGLRENLTAVPRPVADGRLIDTGVYGLVRHPIYSGIVLAAVGWGLVAASAAAVLVAVLLGVFFDLKSRREEAWLLAAYPAYADYGRRVRKLIPYLY
jgi:protein-S-isoprenylcysteine O-methyltransferase Ste14